MLFMPLLKYVAGIFSRLIFLISKLLSTHCTSTTRNSTSWNFYVSFIKIIELFSLLIFNIIAEKKCARAKECQVRPTVRRASHTRHNTYNTRDGRSIVSVG